MRISATPRWAVGILGCTAALFGSGACSEKQPGMELEKNRIWGREKLAQEIETKAAEKIDPYALDEKPEIKDRVLTMRFEEVVARLGFVQFNGKNEFHLNRNGHAIDLVEQSLIEHGLAGSFRVLQKDADGAVTRETVFDNGTYFARNGPGKLRVVGVLENQYAPIRDEAWQPLRVYASFYGPRFGVKKAGASTYQGRPAVKYELSLLDGPAQIAVEGISGTKQPLDLSGTLFVDEGSGVPIGAKLRGRLAIPTKGDGEPGHLEFSLDHSVKSVEGKEIKPGDFVPTIRRRPVELNPVAFLDGGTRTSTVIGGKKPQGEKAK